MMTAHVLEAVDIFEKKKKMVFMSLFQDKLDCQVFRRIGWNHRRRMETS